MALFDAEHIIVSFDGDVKMRPILAGVSLSLEAGNIYDLVGSSGSGKSTLLRALSRMIDVCKGEMRLEGKSSADFSPTQWRKRICLVPQVATLIPGTVKDNLVFPWKFKVRKEETHPSDTYLVRLLDQAQLSHIELSRDVAQLSGGQAARIALLRAFVTKPQVLLLDEVDAALDNDSANAIGALTQSFVGKDATCLRIRHRPSDGFAHATYTLEDGALSSKINHERKKP